METSSSVKKRNKSKTHKRFIAPRLIKAEHVRAYILKLTFEDGKEKEIDFFQYILFPRFRRKFLNLNKFKKFHVSKSGILIWPGNIMDFPSYWLYHNND